jgi:molecular chaperone DnaK
MVKEAEAHSAEDKAFKDAADTRNEADSMCYMVERQIADLGAAVSAETKSKAELLISDLRKKIEEKAETEVLKNIMNELRGVLILLQQDAAKQGATASAGSGPGSPESGHNGSGSNGSASSTANSGEDVIDAEVRSAD